MQTLANIQKQQVGLRVPKYLLDELDSFTQSYDLNRSEMIIEAIKAFIQTQKEHEFYASFKEASIELKEYQNNPSKPKKSLSMLIEELA